MFEHNNLDGIKNRCVPATESFIAADVLEIREAKEGKDASHIGRQQYGVANGVLVERYLPPEAAGDAWSHDAVAAPWWDVVGHPPHAGIVADYNAANGGAYKRRLDKSNNVVAFTQGGEEVTMAGGIYSVVRKSDGQTYSGPTLVALRAAYYTA